MSAQPCLVYIRRNADGVERCDHSHKWDASNPDEDFIWSEGNYACDCNRALFFAAGGGEDDPNRSCGEAAFSVRITDLDGKELYSDYDAHCPHP